MKEKALEWGFDFSYEEMADALMELFDFTITRQAVAEHLKNADWNVRATSRAPRQVARPLKRAALDTAIRCYYHPGAFGIEKKPGGKHGKKK